MSGKVEGGNKGKLRPFGGRFKGNEKELAFDLKNDL